MSVTSVKLLEAAAEILGGEAALAARLGISESLLAAYTADGRALPDRLLLAAVDIILADRRDRLPFSFSRASAPSDRRPLGEP